MGRRLHFMVKLGVEGLKISRGRKGIWCLEIRRRKSREGCSRSSEGQARSPLAPTS